MAAPFATCLCTTIRSLSTSNRLNKVIPRNLKGGKSSHDWMTRQLNDPYVKLAVEKGFRCRSAFKLIEIDDRYKIFRQGSVVVDCGAAPGSWSQVSTQRVISKERTDHCNEQRGCVIAVDLQHIAPIEMATIFERCDFTSQETQSKILQALKGRLVDVVLSDMAPSATGNKELDHHSIFELCLSVLKFSSKVLASGGHVVCKLWDGRSTDDAKAVMKRMFDSVRVVKPDASRSDSAEIFLLGMDYKLTKR